MPDLYTKLTATVLLSCVLMGCSGAAVNYSYSSLPDPSKAPYRLQPGDVVHLRVLKNDNTTGVYTVRPDGFISVPLGGEIKVKGLSAEQARMAIVESLQKFIEDAKDMISLSIDQTHGISYSVIGEVNRAGLFEALTYVTVLEALANAGGLTVYAQPDALYVLRRQRGGKQLKIPVSYTQTIKSPGGNRNFYLLPGDVIVVP